MGDASDVVVEQIMRDGRLNARSAISDLLQAARKFKPAGYNDHQRKRRRYYEGHQEEYLQEYLRQHYPKAHAEMERVVVNVFRHRAEQLATVYQKEPSRYLLADDGSPVEGGRAAADFAEMVKAGRLASRMLDIERKAMAARGVYIRVTVDAAAYKRDGVAPVYPVAYWPGQVERIPDPDAPSDVQASYALMARISSPDGEGEWWELWTRAEGTFQWYVEHMTVDGKMRQAPFGSEDSSYPLRLPWVAYWDGIPDGSTVLDVDRDSLLVQDVVNATWTDAMFARKFSSHGQLIIKSDTRDDTDLPFGPGRAVRLGSGDDALILSPSFEMTGIEAAERLTAQAAVLDRLSPDAYSAGGNATVTSGIDRVISNLPQQEAREERRGRWADLETGPFGLLSLLAEASDLWGGTKIGTPAGFGIEYTEEEVYEDPSARFARAQDAHAAGLISKARLAVESGFYASIDAAVEAGLSDDLPQERTAPGGGAESLRARLQAARQVAQEQPEEVVDEEAADAG